MIVLYMMILRPSRDENHDEETQRGELLRGMFIPKIHGLPSRKFNIALENGGWKTTFLLGFGNFSGASC